VKEKESKNLTKQTQKQKQAIQNFYITNKSIIDSFYLKDALF